MLEGSTIPLRGIPHVVRLSGVARGTVRTALDASGVAILHLPGSPEHAARRLADHLKAIARADLHAAVSRHSAAIGVVPARIRLKDTTSRWGSASTSGTLSFSWRLALAPPFVLDYLAAHEVAHLREMNHSSRFWAICRRLAPRTDEARAWLKRHGAELHRLI
jgi:predicted metal-dependent hydrolase